MVDCGDTGYQHHSYHKQQQPTADRRTYTEGKPCSSTAPRVHFHACGFFAISVVDCGDPGDPYGGYRHIATDTKYQSNVTYTCKPDHHLEGEDSQTCQADGTWSGSKPVCLGM